MASRTKAEKGSLGPAQLPPQTCPSWVVLQCFLAPTDYTRTAAFITLKAFSLLV